MSDKRPTDPTPTIAADRDNNALERSRDAAEGRFAQLVRDLYAPLCDFAYRLTRNRSDAEDVVQDVLAAVWRRPDELLVPAAESADLRAYLHVAVRNRVRKQLAREAVAAAHVARTLPHLTPDDPATNPAPDVVFAARALRLQIDDALQHLPPQQRAVLLLRRFGELSTAEVADMLSLSVKTVENHLGRALKRLRQRLE